MVPDHTPSHKMVSKLLLVVILDLTKFPLLVLAVREMD